MHRRGYGRQRSGKIRYDISLWFRLYNHFFSNVRRDEWLHLHPARSHDPRDGDKPERLAFDNGRNIHLRGGIWNCRHDHLSVYGVLMLKRLALATLIFGSSPVFADSITVQIVSTVPGASGTLTRTMTLSQADMGSFIAGLEAATSTATPTAAADAWLGALKQEVITIALGLQKQNALATVTPIAPQ